MPLRLNSGVVKVPSDQKVESKKNVLIDKLNLAGKLPKSYTINTSKEETILEYVEDFRRQFIQVFPDRRPLLLCPKNEAGIRKFVCTTVRPSQLPYNSVYDLQDTANFVADFLTYLPLAEPTMMPDILPSPSTTVKMRAGDSLDFANLLCSLLRGNGYNAYVVSGYAPKWITSQDQKKTDCPILASTAMKDESAKEANDEEVKEEQAMTERGGNGGGGGGEAEDGGEGEVGSGRSKSKYQLKVQPSHESKYLALREREKREQEEAKMTEKLNKSQYVMNTVHDPLYSDRIHFWVLVMKGRRDMQEDVYVEPTTGTVWSIADSPYLGIESVWNEQNYWANVQDCPPQEMSLNLSATNCWEYVLIDERQMEKKDDMANNFESVNVDETANTALTPEEAFDDRDILDCPMSWCSRIVIDRQTFRDAYPGGSKRIHYKKCTVEKFAEYYEERNGLVLRVTIFQTEDCLSPIEVREFFQHRKDKLYMRYTYPLENRTHDFFEPGRQHGLKEFIQHDSTRRYFTFYASSREDGMASRDEDIGNKIIEQFENRDDFLTYRSVAVDRENQQNTNRNSKHFLLSLARCGEAPVRKITEKFARNTKKMSKVDVRKRTHFIADGTIRLDYHYAPRAITAHSVLLEKGNKSIGHEGMDLGGDYGRGSTTGDARKGTQDKELLAKLVQKEKELLSKVRDREAHITELLNTLSNEAQKVDNLEKSIYDVAHEQSTVEVQEQDEVDIDEEKDKNRVDYLSPFLAQYPAKLTRRQAMTAKDQCLATLKERLLERANIIQKHLDAENQKLQQRRQQFKRQTGSGAVEADEEFTKFYSESAFRIDILKARLNRHEELALKKYVEMDKRLNMDPRLAILKTPE